MSEPKLTMSSLYRPGWYSFPKRHHMPLLLLVGPWLLEARVCRVRVEVERAGFECGGRVQVQPGRWGVTTLDEEGR